MNCHSCFRPVKTKKEFYCKKCAKELFDGVSILPLAFDKREFYEIRNDTSERISMSGVQDKISLKLEGKELVPTDRNGEYILKPIPSSQLKHSEDIVANEHLSMQISEQIFKIPTAKNGIIEFNDGELAYITKRFDYATDGSKIDQEDFASILEYTQEANGKSYKYDSSYEEIAKGIERSVAVYRPALEDFFRRVMLNYAIGNGDAHLKNFSLYRPENRQDMVLTPNYDLLYTKYHIDETIGEMAMELFDEIETKSYGALGYYSLEDITRFSELLQIPPKRSLKIFTEFVNSISKVEALVNNSFLSEAGKSAYIQNYITRIEKRFCYFIPSSGYEFESHLKEVAAIRMNQPS